jgi:hypothetical protein
MARKSSSNDSIIVLLGGIIILVGVLLSLFVKEFGWWMWDGRIFIKNGEYFLTAFGGEQGSLMGEDTTFYSEEMTQVLAGGLAALGGLLCLSKKKSLGLIGGLLAIVGCILFLVYLGDTDLAKNLADNDLSIFGGEVNNILISGKWQLGYGFIATAVGGILALIAAAMKK